MELSPLKCEQQNGARRNSSSSMMHQHGKEKIPIVHHVLTDQEAGFPEGLKQMNLGRAIKLLTDPHSQHMTERQINALHRIAKRYKNGYLMKDLVQVFKILNICADRITENRAYAEPLCSLLQICRMPFLKEKMSDEITYQQIVIESLSQLGYLMRVPNSAVRTILTHSLSTIYSNPVTLTAQQLQGLKGVNRAYNRKMIEMSDLSETLVKSLSLLAHNLPVKAKVLKLIKQLSNSPANCKQMLMSEAAYRICCDMTSQPDGSGLILFESVEILWNLLENVSETTSAQLANRECVSVIKKKFRELMTSSSSNYQRQLRNDLLVISTLIARHPEAPIIETGFAKDLILFGTFSEVKSHNPLVRNLQLSQCHEDFELKKLLINFLAVMSRDVSAQILYTEGKVILSLFHFVKANSNHKVNSRGWTNAQFEELQLHAISTLSILVSILADEYMACQGNIRLLLLLEWCVSDDDVYSGEGNSFHGSGSRGTKKAQLRYCLRLLRAAVFTGHQQLILDLCDQGVLSQLLQILQGYPESNDVIDIEIQCDLLHILSALCESDVHRKELFGSYGVEVLVTYMKKYMKTGCSSGLGHHRVMLATVDCIGCCVVGCFVTEDFFLENEGIFLLLDLLETSPRSLYNLTLSCLLELTENHKTIPHMHTWRGKDGKATAGHLMAHLWRDEEKMLRVERGEKGVINDHCQPLAGLLQRKQGSTSQPSTSPSSAIVDVSENLRSKIYSIFTRLGFSDLPGLTTEDYVTLAIIEKYLDMKVGEVWKEIADEIVMEGVKPIGTDEEALDTIQRATVERARGVAVLQRELLEAERQQHLIDEKDVYVELKEINRQFENEKVRWSDHVMRTSNYRHLCASKRQQLKSIESSRTKPHFNRKQVKASSSTEFHDTMPKKLHTTTFQGRHVAIETARPEPQRIAEDVV